MDDPHSFAREMHHQSFERAAREAVLLGIRLERRLAEMRLAQAEMIDVARKERRSGREVAAGLLHAPELRRLAQRLTLAAKSAEKLSRSASPACQGWKLPKIAVAIPREETEAPDPLAAFGPMAMT